MVTLPDGTTLRGRGLRAPAPSGPSPEWALRLLGHPPGPEPWPVRWVRWPDFRLPADDADARAAFADALARARAGERVEVACDGGRGRTGTALACIAQLAGVPGDEAVAWIRARLHPRAVETPFQRRYVRRFTASG